jgi:hypothetical protein
VDSPRRLTTDPATARRLLELVSQVPTPTWGRDELAAGEMWNSDSIVAWLLAVGVDVDRIEPPSGGRAPGWHAGLAVARRREAPAGVAAVSVPLPLPTSGCLERNARN